MKKSAPNREKIGTKNPPFFTHRLRLLELQLQWSLLPEFINVIVTEASGFPKNWIPKELVHRCHRLQSVSLAILINYQLHYQGRKNSININFLVRISRGHSWPLRPDDPGSKNFSPSPWPQKNALFGADVHDFWCGRPWPEGFSKNFVQRKFALIFWPLHYWIGALSVLGPALSLSKKSCVLSRPGHWKDDNTKNHEEWPKKSPMATDSD